MCKITSLSTLLLLLSMDFTLSRRTRAQDSAIDNEPLGTRSGERQTAGKRWRRYNIRRVPPHKKIVRKVRCERMQSRDRCAQCQKHAIRLASNSNNVLASKKCSSLVECEDAFNRCFVRKRRILKKLCGVHDYEGVTALKGTIEKNCRVPDLEKLLLTDKTPVIENIDSLCLDNDPTQKSLETGKSFSWFGISVAVSKNIVVVGADRENINGKEYAGAAYVYNKDGDDWKQQAKLIAGDVTKDALFGRSVAINSAGDTILVGVLFWSTSKPGAAYVFHRTGLSWKQVAKLTGDSSSRDWFGAAVAIDDNTIVVGASADESDRRGGAYVFAYNGSKWSRSAKLTAPSTGGEFGYAVDIEGDRIVIGDRIDADYAGAVHVYSRSGSGWTKEATLYANDAAWSDGFGYSVALDGDTIAVGADADDNPKGTDAGAVYVFDRQSSGSWKQTGKLTASDGAGRDWFGYSVALQNSVLVVGTYYANKAYVYARSGSTWGSEKKKLTDPNGSGAFGSAVALDGTTVVVGDYYELGSDGRATIFEFC